jgi:NitT/TauT family transport system permease protein
VIAAITFRYDMISPVSDLSLRDDFEPSSQSLKPTTFWRIAEDIPNPLYWLLVAVSVIFPLSVWWVVSNLPGVTATFLPSPQEVAAAFQHLWSQGFLTQDTLASFGRVSVGFLLAAVISIPLGISMGAFPSIRALAEPLMSILRYMPAPAFIPLLIIYLGLNEEPKIALIFIGTVFFNTLMIMDAVKFVPKDLIETTYTLGGQRWQVLTSVIAPYVVPNIIDTFRINIATSWNLVVVAELVAAEEGLGKRILLAQRFLKTDEIFAYLIVLGVIGFMLDILFRWLLKLTCKWSID